MRSEFFSDCQLWPLYLSLFNCTAVTLWGCAELEEDKLLVKDNEILLFPSEKKLIKFIKSDAKCNFTNTPGYVKLQNKVRASLWDEEDERAHFDFQWAGSLLEEFKWKEWDAADSSMIVNCMNTLMDAAVSLGDEETTNLFMHQRGVSSSFLNIFLDELTFYDPLIPGATLNLPEDFDAKEVFTQYSQALGKICIRMRYVKR